MPASAAALSASIHAIGMNVSSATIDLFTRHALARSQAALNTALERLSTGTRINRASDDPAGLIAAERLEGQTRALEKTINRLEFDNHKLAAKDGAMSVLSDMAADLEGLTVAAANKGAMSDAEREALQIEADSILQGMGHVIATSTFNGEKLINLDLGEMGELSTYIEVDGEQQVQSQTLADLISGGSLNLVDGDIETAQRVVAKTVGTLATMRGAIGSQMQSNESRIRTSLAEFEGTSAALSEIRDTDYYAEITAMSRAQILEQAGLRTLMIGQQTRERTLGLLLG